MADDVRPIHRVSTFTDSYANGDTVIAPTTNSGSLKVAQIELPHQGITLAGRMFAISAGVLPRYATWSTLTFVTTATRPSITLVASQVPPMPTSTIADGCRCSRNAASAARSSPPPRRASSPAW